MKKMLAVALVALALAPSLLARSKPAPTAPGKYKEWGRDIDEIEVVKTFKLSDYDKVVVLPFDTTGTPLPEKTEKSYATIKSVLAGYSLTLAEALRPELKAKLDVDTVDKVGQRLVQRGRDALRGPGRGRAGRPAEPARAPSATSPGTAPVPPERS